MYIGTYLFETHADNYVILLNQRGLDACWMMCLSKLGLTLKRAELGYVCHEMTGSADAENLSYLKALIQRTDGVELDQETSIVSFGGKIKDQELKYRVENAERMKFEMFQNLNGINLM